MTTRRRWSRRSAVLITCAGAMSVAGCTPGTPGSVASPSGASGSSSPTAHPAHALTTVSSPALPDPRPRTDDLAVPDSLRQGTPAADVAGTGSAPLPLGRMPARATHLTFAWVCVGGGELDLLDSAGHRRVTVDCSGPAGDQLGQSADVPGQSTRSRWRVHAGPATRWRVPVAAR